MIRDMKAFPHELIKQINDGDEPHAFELGLLFQSDTKNILDTLDDQARSTIKTILMVEYSRCNNVSGDAVIKLFEGMDLSNNEMSQNHKNTKTALKNIQRKRAGDE